MKDIILAGNPEVYEIALNILTGNMTKKKRPDLNFLDLDQLLPEEMYGEKGLDFYASQIQQNSIKHPHAIIWGPHPNDGLNWFKQLNEVGYKGKKIFLCSLTESIIRLGKDSDENFHMMTDGYVGDIVNFID